MDTFFAAAGRFAVRFRWAIVLAWAAGAAAAMALLPSLSSVTQSDSTSFLPASAPSQQAARLASPLQGATLTAVTVVGARPSGALTGADEAFVARIEGTLTRIPRVVAVRDAGQSADGRAEQLTVLAALAQSGGLAAAQQATLVGQIRDAIRTAGPGQAGQGAAPPGFSVHTAGPVATRADTNATSGKTGGQVQWFSIAFVIALLVAVFRSALAPLIAVLPAVVVVLAAERLTAEAAVHGLGVSQIASLLLIVLVLGAGTDYALFLMFRVREEMRERFPAGGSGGVVPPRQRCHEAIVLSVARVGETITFSAGVLVAALLSLAAATFSLYSGLAAPLAIAIGLMLAAGLTLLPALLAICGPVAFWPSSVRPGTGRPGWWGPTCSRIVRRPLTTLLIGLVLFCALAVASAGYLAAGFGGAVTGPAGSDSAAGNRLLSTHFPRTAANPTVIVLRLRQPAWADAGAVAAAERQLAADPVFTSVSGPLNANGTALTAAQYSALHAAYGPPRATRASAAARIPPARLAAYQSYRASGSFVSADGLTISFATSLAAGNPTTTAAARAVPAVRAAAARAARTAGARAAGVTGQAAFTYDVAQLSDGDLWTVIPIAVAVIAVLLALVMRSLIAPLYLIVSVVLSYFAALGLTVLVFITAAGQPGLTFILPFLLFVFLLALGEDYNILVMTRIREEAQRLPLREAVGRALSVTGTTVTSAGLVLAGTFGVLAIVGSGSAGTQNVRTIVNVGVGLALGVLMDTFLVRTLLVPSAVVLIGRWNWWPSALCRARPDATAAAPPDGGPAAVFTRVELLLKMPPGGARAMGRLTEVAPGVLVATSAYAMTTSTVVIGSSGGCLLIDPAVTVDDLAALAGELAGRGLRPAAAWSTHPHWDHVLWSAVLGDAPRYAAPAAVTIAETERDGILAYIRQSVPGHDLDLVGRMRALDAPAIPWDGPEARLIVHDGHAPGHGAVFLPETGVLVAGDMCSDIEIPLLDTEADDPLGDYRTGLERLGSVSGVRLVVPGHGHLGGDAERRRRLALDAAYLDAISAGRPYDDPRLTPDSPKWMRAMHEDQVRYFQR